MRSLLPSTIRRMARAVGLITACGVASDYPRLANAMDLAGENHAQRIEDAARSWVREELSGYDMGEERTRRLIPARIWRYLSRERLCEFAERLDDLYYDDRDEAPAIPVTRLAIVSFLGEHWASLKFVMAELDNLVVTERLQEDLLVTKAVLRQLAQLQLTRKLADWNERLAGWGNVLGWYERLERIEKRLLVAWEALRQSQKYLDLGAESDAVRLWNQFLAVGADITGWHGQGFGFGADEAALRDFIHPQTGLGALGSDVYAYRRAFSALDDSDDVPMTPCGFLPAAIGKQLDAVALEVVARGVRLGDDAVAPVLRLFEEIRSVRNTLHERIRLSSLTVLRRQTIRRFLGLVV